MTYPSGKTHLYAILADPVAHVRASEFFAPIIAQEKRDAFIVPMHVLPKDLHDIVPMLQRIGNIKGLVITLPHKETMAKLCDELSPVAQLSGTVNTVRFEPDGRLSGEMFDGIGLVNAARAHDIEPKGSTVLIAGAGGAGRAIAFAFADEGAARITIANRTESKARELAAIVQAVFPEVKVEAGPADPSDHDLIINCTSLGLNPSDVLPIDHTKLMPTMSLIDIISVRETELLNAAKKAGLDKVMGGRPMVEHQVLAQLNFLGAPPV